MRALLRLIGDKCEAKTGSCYQMQPLDIQTNIQGQLLKRSCNIKLSQKKGGGINLM